MVVAPLSHQKARIAVNQHTLARLIIFYPGRWEKINHFYRRLPVVRRARAAAGQEGPCHATPGASVLVFLRLRVEREREREASVTPTPPPPSPSLRPLFPF